jgi:threonine dehydratase
MRHEEAAKIFPQIEDIYSAAERLKKVISHTPLQTNLNLSERYEAKIFLKREDLQIVRSYKIRGAYNKMAQLPSDAIVVCASAGNHAQGVAYACRVMAIKGTIFMPTTTPNQKVKQVKMFGKDMVDVRLVGDTFDDAFAASMKFCDEQNATFVHPFDDSKVIEGQGTVGLEIFEAADSADVKIDYLLLAIGGGGLASGVSIVCKQLSPNTKIIGIEPEGAAAMKESFEKGEVVTLETVDKFVDGAAVKKVGDLTFEICRENLDRVISVPEGKVCSTILQLYNEEAIVAEPAGALTIAALDFIKDEIKGKNVVCLVSGGNNDITRTEEIKERSLLFEGLKHYFIIRFPQRAGALREFLSTLGPDDDITHFEYVKKTSREQGPALVGIELKDKNEFEPLLERMNQTRITYEYINDRQDLFQFLV